MQRWVYQEGWTSLHDAQEQAIAPIVGGGLDVIISAATAAGKTEAAFLPICSALAAAQDAAEQATVRDPWRGHDPWDAPPAAENTGIQVLYLSPLKALINDQFRRLEALCESASIPVHRWHGDVSASAKARVRRNPSGILLITPESLEATFATRGSQIARQFAGLRYVVIDELHSFLAEPRGAQLQSLLGRLELVLRRRPPRIGLSATIGDLRAAAEFLRPTKPDGVLVITSDADKQELKCQIRGYRSAMPNLDGAGNPDDGRMSADVGESAIAEHLFDTLRGTDNLVFANARSRVETFADMLARRCEQAGVPNEFWPHHGSLAKDVREHVEAQLKDRNRPVTAICTSTLEMGIDIGSVASVAQIGPPPSVAALRQRLGRSGRRDEAAVLRMYIQERDLDVRSSPIDQLRARLVQSIAMTDLLLRDRWIEPPDDPGMNLSTLIQQILSLIAQHGGVTPKQAHQALCAPGPFAQVDARRFGALLRDMAAADLITQSSDGLLLHAPTGERIVNHYSFYSAFQTAEEWRLIAGGRTLGSLPITEPLIIGGLLIFAGRRWLIRAVDETAKVVELARASGGVPPRFGGGGAPVSDMVRERMVQIYESDEMPAYLDRAARELLNEARENWRRLRLSERHLVGWGTDTFVLPWVGDAALGTLAVALADIGVHAEAEGVGLLLSGTSVDDAARAFATLARSGVPDPLALADGVKNRCIDKWDWVLGPELSAAAYAARAFNVERAWAAIEMLAPAGMSDQMPVDDPDPSESSQGAGRHAPTPAMRPARIGTGEEFCVVDVETTGFSPRLGHRVIEIAAVRIRANGEVLDEWSTLVNPARDIGASHIHGIKHADVADAPTFAEIAGDLLARLDGAVLVAHNLRFDRGFLETELDTAGHRIAPWPGLCTLALARRITPGASRKLADCCAERGITLDAEHSALGDARASSRLLVAYLDLARAQGLRDLEALGCEPLTWPTHVPAITPSGLRHVRGPQAPRVDPPGGYVAGLVREIDGHDAELANTAAYLDLLDRVLEDRKVSAEEAQALADMAQEWGLSRAARLHAHRHYLSSLCEAARVEDSITAEQRRDIAAVAQLLSLSSTDLDAAIRGSAHRPATVASPVDAFVEPPPPTAGPAAKS